MDNNKFKPKAPLIGANGNIFNLLGIAQRELRRNGMKEEADDLYERVKQCGSYDEALNTITEYVEPVDESEMEEDIDQCMKGY